MQQRPEPPSLDLEGLPESVRKAVAAAQPGGGAAQAQPGPPEPSSPPVAPPGPARLDDRTMLEVEAVRRRQLREAFMRGQPGPYAGGARAGLGLWGGLAIAIALALAIGLVALIQGTIEQQGKQHAALPRPDATQLARPPL
jgi:hypothetical protein